ncbi:MAG TPA: HPF/RaiA family ribosome-associated protein [Actinomycetota bacterium]|nr:HPF/RaiA family ribosome-associated protein [Actinomycetota bacterium]
MRISVSSPGIDLTDADVDRIANDLEKIDRRLNDWDQVDAEVRVNSHANQASVYVVLELHYGPNHLIAKADAAEVGLAVREAREEILRQINDRSRGGHSSFAKGR